MDVIVATDRADLGKAMDALGGGRVALVPTMGALHDGHRALIRLAHEYADHVVVSVFVNPLQFGPGEDFTRYPRTFPEDLAVCAAENVAVLFAPTADDMYPSDRQVGVSSGQMGTLVEGAFRPGHFDGVLTVVLKLFHLVRPDVAIFGQKDAQQLALIRRMVADLNVPVSIVAAPTVREDDGLALSSRNRYLSADERGTATALSRALREGTAHSTPSAILATAQAVLDEAARLDPPLRLDYVVLVDPNTFTPVTPDHQGEAILAVAGRVGTTRLIDNVTVRLGQS